MFLDDRIWPSQAVSKKEVDMNKKRWAGMLFTQLGSNQDDPFVRHLNANDYYPHIISEMRVILAFIFTIPFFIIMLIISLFSWSWFGGIPYLILLGITGVIWVGLEIFASKLLKNIVSSDRLDLLVRIKDNEIVESGDHIYNDDSSSKIITLQSYPFISKLEFLESDGFLFEYGKQNAKISTLISFKIKNINGEEFDLNEIIEKYGSEGVTSINLKEIFIDIVSQKFDEFKPKLNEHADELINEKISVFELRKRIARTLKIRADVLSNFDKSVIVEVGSVDIDVERNYNHID